jgi:hypothetical protein
MKKIALTGLALSLLSVAATAEENPLTISIVKIKRSGPETTFLLFSVENPCPTSRGTRISPMPARSAPA